jgi:hypothetical protein
MGKFGLPKFGETHCIISTESIFFSPDEYQDLRMGGEVILGEAESINQFSFSLTHFEMWNKESISRFM